MYRSGVFAAYLPSSGGCFYIDGFPQSIGHVRGTWDQYWDPLVPVLLFLGYFLACARKRLARGMVTHAITGSLVCLFFFLQLFICLGRLNIRGPSFLVAFSSASMEAFGALFMQSKGSNWLELMRALVVREPFFNLPIGWLIAIMFVFALLVIISLGAVGGIWIFATCSPSPKCGNSMPSAQRYLSGFLWMIGISTLVLSSHSDLFSALHGLVALLVTGSLSVPIARAPKSSKKNQ